MATPYILRCGNFFCQQQQTDKLITLPFVGNVIMLTDGLAWDWTNEKFYWTDNCADDLEVFDGDRKVLITGSSSAPRSIVLDRTTR